MSVDYVAIGVIAFAASIVRGIVKPDRRGLAGFISAIVVGICCGMVAAVVAGEFGVGVAWQYLYSALFAIFGDRFVYSSLTILTTDKTPNSYTFNGQTNAQFGDGSHQNHDRKTEPND